MSEFWFFLRKIAGSPGYNPYVALYNETAKFAVESRPGEQGNVSIQLFLPVQKGQTIRVDYDATGATNHFRFIYAEGSESEA